MAGKGQDAPLGLTRGQQSALRQARKGRNLFITGGGGTGKTELARRLIREQEEAGRNVIVCAPTGMAALNIGGVTIHRAFGFPTGTYVGADGILTRVTQAIRMADLVLIDELSMVRMDLFDALATSLQKAEADSGRQKQLVVVGDLYQLPPILSDQYERKILEDFYGREVGNAYAFQGQCWEGCGFHTVVLDETVRQKDPAFIDLLNKARVGDVSCLDGINSRTYAMLDREPVTLHAYKDAVDSINQIRLGELEGRPVSFQTIVSREGGGPPDGAQEDACTSLGIPKSLVLKEGASVIFTATAYQPGRKSLAEGWVPSYVNGMVGTVFDVGDATTGMQTPRTVSVMTREGPIEVHPVTTPVYSYVPDGETITRVKVASYTQLPLALSYALTIHRAQGQSYEAVKVHPSTFAPGQLYVALSRARTLEGLSLTRRVVPGDFHIDPLVTEFYGRIGANGMLKGRPGRPPKNQDGSRRDKSLWVPAPLVPHVQIELSRNCIIPLEQLPPFTEGRRHLRVPEALYEDMREQIQSWKQKIRGMPKRHAQE